MVHFDVMDGQFVPAFGLPRSLLCALERETALPVGVHLMCLHPEKHVASFSLPNVGQIAIHIESAGELAPEILRLIHKAGKAAWLAFNPDTPPADVLPYCGMADGVLVMSCEPGMEGAQYSPATPKRISWLRKMAGDGIGIMVDGALDETTAAQCVQAGADHLVMGRSFFAGS